jgi:hypothetical protein
LLVGDLSTETADPDYFLRPVDLGDTRHNTWSASAPSCWWRRRRWRWSLLGGVAAWTGAGGRCW